MTIAKLPKLNKPLLKRIIKHIAEEPLRYIQDTWVEQRTKAIWSEEAPACETVGCIAGWAVFLSTPKKNWLSLIRKQERVDSDYIRTKARKLLGLTEGEAMVLFSPNNQERNSGPEGVKSASNKIHALLEDREEFAAARYTQY